MNFFSAGNYYGLIDTGIYLCYAGSIIGIILAVLFPVYFIIKEPKQAKTTLMGIGFAAILFGLSYAISSGEVTEKYMLLGVATESQSKLVGAGLILLYITGIGALLLAVGSEIMGIFRK